MNILIFVLAYAGPKLISSRQFGLAEFARSYFFAPKYFIRTARILEARRFSNRSSLNFEKFKNSIFKFVYVISKHHIVKNPILPDKDSGWQLSRPEGQGAHQMIETTLTSLMMLQPGSLMTIFRMRTSWEVCQPGFSVRCASVLLQRGRDFVAIAENASALEDTRVTSRVS